jgi:hypothetical protein
MGTKGNENGRDQEDRGMRALITRTWDALANWWYDHRNVRVVMDSDGCYVNSYYGRTGR